MTISLLILSPSPHPPPLLPSAIGVSHIWVWRGKFCVRVVGGRREYYDRTQEINTARAYFNSAAAQW